MRFLGEIPVGRRWIFVAAALVIAVGADARPPAGVPEIFRSLIDCRAIADPTQRLVCFDQKVEAIDVAQKKKDIVVVSKAEVKEARQSLFGFQLPNLKLFGGNDQSDKSEDIRKIETVIASASPTKDGNWVLVLAEGGTWETRTELVFPPRSGQKIIIEKAMLSSFLAKVGNNLGVRMRRIE